MVQLLFNQLVGCLIGFVQIINYVQLYERKKNTVETKRKHFFFAFLDLIKNCIKKKQKTLNCNQMLWYCLLHFDNNNEQN